MLNPIHHAEVVTGRRQSVLLDLWSTTGLAATLSEVTGPHVYDYGSLPVSTVVVTMYDVRRHVLIEDGRVRRDAGVLAGRFRIGQPGRSIVVDAVPATSSGHLVLLYLGSHLMTQIGAARGGDPVELVDTTWDVDDPFLSLTTRRIVEASSSGPGRSLLVEQLLLGLALHIADRYGVSKARGSERKEELSAAAVARIHDSIRQSSETPVKLESLAQLAGVSASCLLRRFKKSTGMTPHQFALKQRVLVAQDLLRTTDRPLAQVAHETGFSSQSHFGSTFRTAVGSTPAEYRRAARSRLPVF